jgi:polyisoprenoid-binding protein YceI
MHRLFISSIIALIATAAAHATDFAVDSSHSDVGFKVKHMMVSNVRGRFADYTGSFSLAEDGKLSALTGTVQVGTIDTGNKKRDDHLKAADFFDVANHPQMTFEMKSYKGTETEGKATGVMTIRGKSQPVVFEVERSPIVKGPWGKTRCGLSAKAKINRQHFDLSFNKKMDGGGLVVADTVVIELEIEGIAKTKE